MEEASTDKYIGFAAVDVHALAEQLNAFVANGGTITSVEGVCGGSLVSALVVGSEPDEEE
jgi:hypothetical protein